MTRINADFLQDSGLQQVLALLEQGGHQALIVGGAVRNALLGQPVADVDLATDALPAQVTALAQAAGLRVIPTGLAHGTVTVLTPGALVSGALTRNGKSYEITTFRHDLNTDGRHAKIAFCSDITQDAQRRDFTMNALYARADGTVLDPLGGLPDLLARRLRFVGDPLTRISEDFLRILRFFRFHAWYGAAGQADPEALAACRAQAAGLARLSKERVGSEMLKLLAAPDPQDALDLMQGSGVLAQILPGAQTALIPPLLAVTQGQPDPLLRLAALGADNPRRDLRLDNGSTHELALLARLTDDSTPLPHVAYHHGAQTASRLALLRLAHGQELSPDWRSDIQRACRMPLPLRATDLMPALAGPALGRALQAAKDHWIASGFTATQEELLGVARKAASRN